MKTISLSRPMNLIQRYVAIRCLALAMVAAVFAPHVARTQTPVDDLIFTVGTTYRSGNQDWSFVLVGAADAALVRGKRFAVFGKPGDASAAGTYTQRGTMFRQTDPTAVNTLLNQSVSLGQDLTGLADSINMLLRRVPGITNQPLPQKVLTLFQNAETNASSAAVLALLTVGHPGLRLCLGQAFAETLPTTTTYEVREVNPLTGVAANVVGRVTVVPGAPVDPARARKALSSRHQIIRMIISLSACVGERRTRCAGSRCSVTASTSGACHARRLRKRELPCDAANRCAASVEPGVPAHQRRAGDHHARLSPSGLERARRMIRRIANVFRDGQQRSAEETCRR
jgi:hypothetical protein